LIPLALSFDDPTLLGVAALITAISGIVTTIFSARSKAKEAREEAEEKCRLRLQETREESERCAQELHRLKMKIMGDPEYGEK
jgi:hypothetical protein